MKGDNGLLAGAIVAFLVVAFVMFPLFAFFGAIVYGAFNR